MKEKPYKLIFGLILCLICQAGIAQVPGFTFGFHAQTLSDSEILLKWTDNNSETYYSIERSLTPETGFIEIARTGPDEISYVDGNLPLGTKYYYRIIAGNEEGTAASYSREWLASTLGFVDALEYFIDTDPGHGLGTSVPITSAYDISDINFSVDISSLDPGFHTLYLRAKDEVGQWSLTHNRTFFKLNIPDQSDIVKVEYFIDTDPGFGAGIDVPLTASTDISDLSFPVDISILEKGFHTVYIRAQDSQGSWSITNYSSFYTDGLPEGLSDIVKVEYFIDQDPGFGSGTEVAFAQGQDVSADFTIDLTAVPEGDHILYVRAMDSNESWSITNISNFKICQPSAGPLADDTVYYCMGDASTALTATGSDLKWYNSESAITPLASAPTPLTDTPGLTYFYVTQTIDGCESERKKITVKVKSLPAKPAINYTYDLNSSEYTLTSSSETNNQWIYEGSEIAGANASQYVTAQAGNYQVKITVDGCSSTSDEVMVDIVTGAGNSAITFFNIAPNPAKDDVLISVNNGTSENSKIILWNSQGIRLAEKETANSATVSLDISAYSSGVYFVQMLSGSKTKIEKLIIE